MRASKGALGNPFASSLRPADPKGEAFDEALELELKFVLAFLSHWHTRSPLRQYTLKDVLSFWFARLSLLDPFPSTRTGSQANAKAATSREESNRRQHEARFEREQHQTPSTTMMEGHAQQEDELQVRVYAQGRWAGLETWSYRDVPRGAS